MLYIVWMMIIIVSSINCFFYSFKAGVGVLNDAIVLVSVMNIILFSALLIVEYREDKRTN